MKKLIAILLALALIFTAVGCGDKNTASDNDDKNVYTEGGVEISTEAFPENTVLKVEAIKSEDKKYETVKTALPKALKIDAYEITAESDGVEVQPDGTVQVTFPVPASYDSTKHDIEVYFVADDGKTEKITASIKADGVVAELKHFSTYVVILVEKKTADSNDTTTDSSSEGSSAPSSSTPSSSKPSSTTTPEPEEIQIPKISEQKAEEMASHFIWASKFAANEEGRRYTDFYNENFKNLRDLTVITFLYRYCGDELKKYQTQDEMGCVTTVPKTVLDKLAKQHLGYTYDFTKTYTEEDYMILIQYDSKKKNVIFTEIAGGFGDPDGFRFKGYNQSGDTLTMDLIYYTHTEEKPQGTEGKDWIDASEEDYICYIEFSDPSTLTFKYVDGAWRIISFKAK